LLDDQSWLVITQYSLKIKSRRGKCFLKNFQSHTYRIKSKKVGWLSFFIYIYNKTPLRIKRKCVSPNFKSNLAIVMMDGELHGGEHPGFHFLYRVYYSMWKTMIKEREREGEASNMIIKKNEINEILFPVKT